MAPTAGTILRMKKAGKPKKKTQSLKNKVRNLERFLKKDTLPDDIRAAKAEELAALHAQMGTKAKQEQEREIALKYRKVKFFDRRRVMRTLKKLKQQLASEPTKALEKEYEAAKKDMMYIYYYPKGEKYINLFPDKAKKPLSTEDLARQAELKKAAVKAYKVEESHASFDSYCFCDAKEPTAAESDEEAASGDEETKKPKRKATEAKHKSKKRKTAADVQVVADMEAAAAAQDEDDFFM
ncbi:hypothetical protein ACHHYP_12748 [Achlya hypogyna]|uniref:rRNA-processing protein EFG1 n=1 Tax=Achlya hypogyna TaxID=1202772 RepID=A0A1V9ZGI3_ACHHY|nr:hypothetical protein ACHHYP_12748 [Achlya hypogyna]